MYHRWVAYVARYTNREEARSIDARTTHVSVHSGRTYGPVCIRAHVVSNRYRGYRQTGGEINTHRPAASATTTSIRISHIYVYLYIAYISARQRRDRGFAEIALVSRYVDSVTRAHIRGVPLLSIFSLMIDSRMELGLSFNWESGGAPFLMLSITSCYPLNIFRYKSLKKHRGIFYKLYPNYISQNLYIRTVNGKIMLPRKSDERQMERCN